MNKFISLVINDFRMVVRDRAMLLFLSTPILLLLFVRYAVPQIVSKFDVVNQYVDLVVMFGALQTAIMYGFLTAFAFLNEKDEKVMGVIRILPISSSYFIAYRVLLAFLISFLGSAIILGFNGLINIDLSSIFFLSILFGLVAPFISLVIGAFARNKIEGMAYFKGLDLLLLVPVLSFFVDGAIEYLFAIIPSFWIFKSFELLTGSGELEAPIQFVIYFSSFIYILICIFWANSMFRKKVYDSI